MTDKIVVRCKIAKTNDLLFYDGLVDYTTGLIQVVVFLCEHDIEPNINVVDGETIDLTFNDFRHVVLFRLRFASDVVS